MASEKKILIIEKYMMLDKEKVCVETSVLICGLPE